MKEDVTNLPFDEGYLLGLLIGDGDIYTENDETRFRLYTTNQTYIEWVTNLFGDFTDRISKKEYNYTYKSKDEKRNSYELFSKSHPRLDYYAEVYSDDERYPIPEEMGLSPEALKMWHASDGTLNWQSGARNPTLQLATDTKQPVKEKYIQLFNDIGVKLKSSDKAFYFSTQDTLKLIQYMGHAVPGFEYKWETGSRERYERVKR
jgi:hypothetical protein